MPKTTFNAPIHTILIVTMGLCDDGIAKAKDVVTSNFRQVLEVSENMRSGGS
jgi:hypothetical protein